MDIMTLKTSLHYERNNRLERVILKVTNMEMSV